MASTTSSTTTPPGRACSLGAERRNERLRDWKALRADALIDERVTGETTIVTLRPGADVMRRLQALIEAERDCCSFLRFRVTEDDERIAVEVTATTDD